MVAPFRVMVAMTRSLRAGSETQLNCSLIVGAPSPQVCPGAITFGYVRASAYRQVADRQHDRLTARVRSEHV
jgi:hypothetical protein